MTNFHSKSNLKFNRVSKLDVKKEILNLSCKTATRKGDIPIKIIKNIYLSEPTLLINNFYRKGVLPDYVKLADIKPILVMEKKSSRYLCGFRKNHNAQYSLLKMIEN